MKVYSLNVRQGEPRFLQAVQANYWFWQRGYEVVNFEREELAAGRLDDDLRLEPEGLIVCASVVVVQETLARAGRPAPGWDDVPESLQQFLGREVASSTMGEVRNRANASPEGFQVHVKPSRRQKLFAGTIVQGFRDFIPLSGVPDDEPVTVQEVVRFASEWRAYVLRGRIVGVANYKGDPMQFPSAHVLQQAVERFADAPIGYGIDWGVTDDGRTLLIEANDGYALGNYGLRGSLYTALIECRWRELMGLADSGVGI